MNQNSRANSVQIVTFDDKYSGDFSRLNLEWLERYELIEDIDGKYLEHPRETILDNGGEIFFALIDGAVVGTGAAVVYDERSVELAKLAVDHSARGCGIGQLLTETVIDWAKQRGAEKVVLVSSTKLKTALRLYERLGFVYCPLPADIGYETADIYMELVFHRAQSNAGSITQ
jgi:GNAT superfamily N-acetyltransferase